MKIPKTLPPEKRGKSDGIVIKNLQEFKAKPVNRTYVFSLVDVTEEAKLAKKGYELIFTHFASNNRVAALHNGKILGYAPEKYARLIFSAQSKGRTVFGTILSVSQREGKSYVRVKAMER